MATFKHRTFVDTDSAGNKKSRVITTNDPDIIARLRTEKTGDKALNDRGEAVDVYVWDEIKG